MDVAIDLVKLNEMTEGTHEVPCPVTHHFAPSVYVREIFMPSGTLVLGHKHLTKHINNVVTGRLLLYMGDEVTELVAPCTFISEAGVQKALHIIEDCIWQTVHPNPEDIEDIDQLEELLVDKTANLIQLEELTKLTWPSLT